MSFPLKITGDVSNNVAEVTDEGNLKTTGPIIEAEAGFTAMMSELDSGSITGERSTRALEVTHDFRLRTGTDTAIFNESFPGSAFNTALWTTPVTTMTATVSAGFANLNAGVSTASGAVARLQTYRHFPIYKTFTTMMEMEVQFTQVPQTSNVCEWGGIICTGTAAPTDGAFFRFTSTGEFRCILNNNGTETQSAALNFAALVGTNTTKQFLIYFGSTAVKFWIDNIMVAEIATPDGQGSSLASMNIPMCFRNYNTGVTSAAQVMKVGNVNVTLGEQGITKPWSDVLAGMGANAFQGQTGGTMGSTALFTNSMAPGAGAALTNTTAAAGVGFGGQFSVQPTLAANTDGILDSYLVPIGTAAVPGKTLYLKSLRIQGLVTTALVGGPVFFAYSLACGHNALSLATAESATTKAPRRIALGYEVFPVTAPAGQLSTGPLIDLKFESAIPVQPGEYLQLVVKNFGTVTSAGVITILVTPNGYPE